MEQERPPTRGTGVLLLTMALVAVGTFSILQVSDVADWARLVVLVSLALWLARIPLVAHAQHRGATLDLRTDVGVAVATALTGAVAASASDGVGVLPAAVALVVVLGTPAVPLVVGAVASLLTVAALGVGALLSPLPVVAFLSLLASLALGVLAGLSRRQFRASQQRLTLLREQQVALRADAARIALARDLHDVLAHSLGGLVVQLDAVEALLEAGQVGPATERVGRARDLAARGLRDARGAVAALREPEARQEPVPARTLARAVEDLVSAETSLGSHAELRVNLPPGDGATGPTLPDDVTTALVRVAQESLTNARAHAPGQPVTVGLRVDVGDVSTVRLTVTNPLPDAPPDAATRVGGYGLQGIRERVGALGDGASILAGATGELFVVDAVVPLDARANATTRATATTQEDAP